jgi:hypothetical protein
MPRLLLSPLSWFITLTLIVGNAYLLVTVKPKKVRNRSVPARERSTLIVCQFHYVNEHYDKSLVIQLGNAASWLLPYFVHMQVAPSADGRRIKNDAFQSTTPSSPSTKAQVKLLNEFNESLRGASEKVRLLKKGMPSHFAVLRPQVKWQRKPRKPKTNSERSLQSISISWSKTAKREDGTMYGRRMPKDNSNRRREVEHESLRLHDSALSNGYLMTIRGPKATFDAGLAMVIDRDTAHYRRLGDKVFTQRQEAARRKQLEDAVASGRRPNMINAAVQSNYLRDVVAASQRQRMFADVAVETIHGKEDETDPWQASAGGKTDEKDGDAAADETKDFERAFHRERAPEALLLESWQRSVGGPGGDISGTAAAADGQRKPAGEKSRKVPAGIELPETRQIMGHEDIEDRPNVVYMADDVPDPLIEWADDHVFVQGERQFNQVPVWNRYDRMMTNEVTAEKISDEPILTTDKKIIMSTAADRHVEKIKTASTKKGKKCSLGGFLSREAEKFTYDRLLYGGWDGTYESHACMRFDRVTCIDVEEFDLQWSVSPAISRPRGHVVVFSPRA